MEYNSTQSKYRLGTIHSTKTFKEKVKAYPFTFDDVTFLF